MNIGSQKFIGRAQDIHGEVYDYSKVVYTRAIDKVVIICKKHGEFEQQASEHLRGRGCRSCGFERMTTADFIVKSQAVHGNRYNYSESEFVTSHTKTTVICSLHGPFKVSPNKHQRGSGCPNCSRVRGGKRKSRTAAKDFLERARAKHGDAIDFSKAVYSTAKTPTIFICPAHGAWNARPDNILSGKGCPGCRHQNILVANQMKSSNAADQFSIKGKEVHLNKYEYTRVKYNSVHEKVEIICPEHGAFWQSPANHLSGKNGCPDCSIFGYRTSNSGWLYLQSLDDEFIKIGITNHTPERRLKEHKKNSRLEHKIIGKWFFEDGNIPLEIETCIKRSFKCGVVSSDVMDDGHSETMFIADMPKVLAMIRELIRNKTHY